MQAGSGRIDGQRMRARSARVSIGAPFGVMDKGREFLFKSMCFRPCCEPARTHGVNNLGDFFLPNVGKGERKKAVHKGVKASITTGRSYSSSACVGVGGVAGRARMGTLLIAKS